jgi:hypothetical protein
MTFSFFEMLTAGRRYPKGIVSSNTILSNGGVGIFGKETERRDPMNRLFRDNVSVAHHSNLYREKQFAGVYNKTG